MKYAFEVLIRKDILRKGNTTARDYFSLDESRHFLLICRFMVSTVAIKAKKCEKMSGQIVHGIFLLHLHITKHINLKGGK